MTVRGKLTLAFGGLAAVIVVVSGIAVKSLGDANARFANFVQGINARQLQTYEVRTAVERRAIAARDLVNAATPQGRDVVKAEVTKAHGDVQAGMALLVKMSSDPSVPEEARAMVAKMEDTEKRYAPVALGIVDLALAGKHDEAIAKMNADCRPLLAALIETAQHYRDFTVARSDKLVEQAAEDYAFQRNVLIAGCLIAFAAAGIAGLLITRSLTRALGAEPGQLGDVAKRVAAGDLSPVAGAAGAANGSVLRSLGDMQQSLATIVTQVRSSSDSIATGSAQISTGNADLSQRTEEQASNLQQTAASMEQLSGTVKTSAETAREASRLAVDAASAAEQGGQTVGQVVSTMRDISTSSQRISDIIGVIDGIAFQTNILALNAAVEAARAGEQGRGFAVVASEVRTLAQRSAEAAKEIKGLIGSSVEKVESGAKQVDQAGTSMNAIVTQVQRVSQMIGELSNATSEQSQGINQVGDAVQQLDQVTQQNAALVEETAAAAESLRNQAAHLAQAMSVFKLDGSPLWIGQGGSPSPAARTASPAASSAARPVAASKLVRPAASKPQVPAVQASAAQPATAGAEDWTTF